MSHLREEIKINQTLLKPLVYVQEFANVSQKEDDISIPGLLAGIFSFMIGILLSFIKDIRKQWK